MASCLKKQMKQHVTLMGHQKEKCHYRCFFFFLNVLLLTQFLSSDVNNVVAEDGSSKATESKKESQTRRNLLFLLGQRQGWVLDKMHRSR